MQDGHSLDHGDIHRCGRGRFVLGHLDRRGRGMYGGKVRDAILDFWGKAKKVSSDKWQSPLGVVTAYNRLSRGGGELKGLMLQTVQGGYASSAT